MCTFLADSTCNSPFLEHQIMPGKHICLAANYEITLLILFSYRSVLFLVAQSCPTLCNSMDCSLLGSSVHGDSSGKNTREGCHTLLQEIFSTQGLNPGLPHWRQILYHLSYQGSPRILQWVAYPFSRGSSRPRN